MTAEWAICIFSLCMTATVGIWKYVPRRRDDVATWRELQRLREDLTSRLDNMQRDLNRIAVKTGTDLWGS